MEISPHLLLCCNFLLNACISDVNFLYEAELLNLFPVYVYYVFMRHVCAGFCLSHRDTIKSIT
jgi:hypothetical protein